MPLPWPIVRAYLTVRIQAWHWQSLFKLVKRGLIGAHQRVVVISTANGLKFPEFKIKYHESRLADVTPQHANVPCNLPADYQQVQDAIFRALDQRRSQALPGVPS